MGKTCTEAKELDKFPEEHFPPNCSIQRWNYSAPQATTTMLATIPMGPWLPRMPSWHAVHSDGCNKIPSKAEIEAAVGS